MYLWNLEWGTLYAFNRMIEKRIIKEFEISKNSSFWKKHLFSRKIDKENLFSFEFETF